MSSLTLVIAACSSGEGIASTIRSSGHHSIADVQHHPGFMDPETIEVTLVPGAADADAWSVWCDVIIPIGVPAAIEVVVLTHPDAELPTGTAYGIWPEPTECGSDAEPPPPRWYGP